MRNNNFFRTLIIALAFLCSASFSQNSFTDSRDGKIYKTVKIGEQVWMAENLNYKSSHSECYENNLFYCNVYGMLYNWKTAINVCPAGWHLPSDSEWMALTIFVGDTISNANTALAEMMRSQYERAGISATVNAEVVKSFDAGIKLKASGAWERFSGELGIDKFGFAALPGGFWHSSKYYFAGVKENGLWWSATEYNEHSAYYREMALRSSDVNRNNGGKSNLFSVRCIQD
jgi:uncharacterized protein (TIGR02145 family)